jgi:hypothetical protein
VVAGDPSIMVVIFLIMFILGEWLVLYFIEYFIAIIGYASSVVSYLLI